MTIRDEPARGILLSGLDGSNLLGFLAAVGTLRVAARANKSAAWRISWKIHAGTWTPFLEGAEAVSQDELIELLASAIAEGGSRAFEISDNLTISPEVFRVKAQEAHDSSTSQERSYADFVAAFGCESLVARNKKDVIQDTSFRTMSGAGHQNFLGFMRELAENTDAGNLYDSLFKRWWYLDDRPSLRWDPMDDRRHALRWMDPSDDPIKTMRGANRLAVEALPLFPTAPVGKRLHTTGFSQSKNNVITWPIWETPLGADVVKSLLSAPWLQKPRPDRRRLQSIGVVEVYRSRRIIKGRYVNFTPAVPA